MSIVSCKKVYALVDSVDEIFYELEARAYGVERAVQALLFNGLTGDRRGLEDYHTAWEDYAYERDSKEV